MAIMMKKSLLRRLGLAMATITALAFIGMISSVFITETLEGQASAINQAGTLRMQSYRIANDVSNITHDNFSSERVAQSQRLADEFQQRLLSPRLTGALAKTESVAIHEAYQTVHEKWRETIRPALDTLFAQWEQDGHLSETSRTLRQEYLALVDRFVQRVDHMVNALEHEVESQISLFRLVQVISLFLTTLVVVVTMFLMHKDVLGPLRELLNAARYVRQGDFSQRLAPRNDDELGQLADAFNMMAEDLSKKYADLETMVQEKTSDLERSNRSLELLYRTTRHLSEAPITDVNYASLIEDIENLVGTGQAMICLCDSGKNHASRSATTHEEIIGCKDICRPHNCQGCSAGEESKIVEVNDHTHQPLRIFTTPIKDSEKQFGVLLLEIPPDKCLEDWQKRLLEAVASHITIALNMAQRASQSRILALLEERSVIARELHDSLAQSLSYLKIQVSRLDAAVRHGEGDGKIMLVTAQLRDGLNRAYRQLRELLTTFRLRMDEAGLNTALEKTVQEFGSHSHLDIQLDNHLGDYKLSPNAEIHVIQVIREALSNVARHARAQQAVVHADCQANGQVTIAIDDDGIGMPNETEREHHYGLAIMQERAHGLAGQLQILPSPLGGTRVELTFGGMASRQTPEHQPRISSTG